MLINRGYNVTYRLY